MGAAANPQHSNTQNPNTQVRTLGEGAFAKVVHCKLKRDGQAELDVAVKLLKPALFSSDLDVSDFVKEGIILKRLRHS
jgi:serine/threonine protein kinase